MVKDIGRADPYTVVIYDGIALPAYATGGILASVPDLSVVDFATIDAGPGWANTTVQKAFVLSHSGNVITVKALTPAGSGYAEAADATVLGSNWMIQAWGH